MLQESHWIDISLPLTTDMVRYPGDPPVHISRHSGQGPEEPIVSHLSLCAHAGTHIDSPLHYVPHGRGIDLMPATAMIGSARVIGIADPHVISVKELQAHEITPGERILFKTRNSSLWQLGLFTEDYVYLSTDGASFLAERSVLAVGIDYLSIGGFGKNESDVHRILLEAGAWIVEGLDLSRVEPEWYDLICMPLRIAGIEAAPARVMIRRRQSPAGEQG